MVYQFLWVPFYQLAVLSCAMASYRDLKLPLLQSGAAVGETERFRFASTGSMTPQPPPGGC